MMRKRRNGLKRIMIDKDELIRIKLEIEKYCPFEFIEYNISEALSYNIMLYSHKSNMILLKMLFSPVFKDDYKLYGCNNDKKVLFLWGSSYMERQDHYEKFKKVVSCCNNYSLLKAEKIINFKNIFGMWRVLVWLWKYRKADINSNLKKYIVFLMYDQYCKLNKIKRVVENDNSIKLGVCWCDVLLSDYLFVKYLQQKGIKTATLQHGMFDPDEYLYKLAYINSSSDYFLCWNKLTKDKAVALGGEENKYVVVGAPQFIDTDNYDNCTITNNGVFGVALSSYLDEYDNIQLLNNADEIVKKYNLKCIVRLHPSLKKEEYSKYFVNDNIIVDNEKNFELYMDKCDFLLIANSGIYFNIIKNMKPFFQYDSGKNKLYKDVKWNKYTSLDELLLLYDRYIKDYTYMEQGLIEAKALYLVNKPERILYEEFFKKF